MCSFVISILVKPARAGWEKIPAARSVVLSEWRTSFEYRSWGKASHLLNSSLFSTLLWIHPHLASPLFNCGHHFSSQLFSGHLSSPQFFSQLFSTVLKFVNLLPPQLNSYHLFPPLLNSSHRFSPLPTSSQLFSTLPSSQLISTLLTSPHLFSTLFNSPQFFQLFPTLSASTHFFWIRPLLFSLLFSCGQHFSALLHSSHLCFIEFCSTHPHLFSTLLTCSTILNPFLFAAKCQHLQMFSLSLSLCVDFTQASARGSFYTEKCLQKQQSFTQRNFQTEKLLQREAFAQRSVYIEKLLHRVVICDWVAKHHTHGAPRNTKVTKRQIHSQPGRLRTVTSVDPKKHHGCSRSNAICLNSPLIFFTLYNSLLYFALLYSSLLYSSLLFSTPLHSTLLCFIYSIHSILVFSILLYSTFLYATLANWT